MSGDTVYTDAFHESMEKAAIGSAEHVVPHLLALARPIASVVDVGCGTGAWLAALAALGVGRVLGLDGDTVDRGRLRIPADRFVAADLTQPISIDERFDLAISLEVAEHLPPKRAATFVDDLVRLAPIVLFSAAVPGQRGAGHVHERWPRYWSALFAAHGYAAIDGLRSIVWQNPQVSWWYRQNLLLFAAPDAIEARPALARARARTDEARLSVAHPLMYEALYRDYRRLAERLRKAEAARGRRLKVRPR